MIKISDEDIRKMSESVEKYFCLKCRNYIEIVRSAKGSAFRDIKLEFEVRNEIIDDNKCIYKLFHKTPEDITITKNRKRSVLSELCD
jgi:hypothetical protein